MISSVARKLATPLISGARKNLKTIDALHIQQRSSQARYAAEVERERPNYLRGLYEHLD